MSPNATAAKVAAFDDLKNIDHIKDIVNDRLASHAFGAVQDIIPDREANIGSIATSIGARATVLFSIVCYGVSGLLLLIPANGYLQIVALTAIPYIINCLPYIDINDKTSSGTNQAWRRFIYINLITGMVITFVLIAYVRSD